MIRISQYPRYFNPTFEGVDEASVLPLQLIPLSRRFCYPQSCCWGPGGTTDILLCLFSIFAGGGDDMSLGRRGEKKSYMTQHTLFFVRFEAISDGRSGFTFG